ncbi:MAG: riboflavin synthase [Bacillota bacterium]
MFTGFVEEIGKIAAIVKSARSARITIKSQKVLEGVQLGDSIATNGICLTVTAFDRDGFTVDAIAETMHRTNLKDLSSGSEINLERALRLGDRLGGHIVSGHIDGTGVIKAREKEDNAFWITVEAPPNILKYIVPKGSVAIDGVSLTVVDVDDTTFKVSIIPHTQDKTTLLKKEANDVVNVECDMIGKYVEKLLGTEQKEPDKKGIDMKFLNDNGFA